MFAYCGNAPVANYDPAGSYYANAEHRITTGCGGRGGVPASNPKSNTLGSNTKTDQKVDKLISSYNGVPVVYIPGSSSFSFGIIMGKEGGENLLRHEYGHTVQLKNLGVKNYYKYVVKPSVARYKKTKNKINPEIYNWDTYYSTPWEYQADQLGGAVSTYQPWAQKSSERYWYMVDNLIN